MGCLCTAVLSGPGVPKYPRRRFGPFHILGQLVLGATATHTLAWPTRAPPAAPRPRGAVGPHPEPWLPPAAKVASARWG